MTDDNSQSGGAYELITPPNQLKGKVGPGKGLDPKLVEQAQALVDNMSDDFEKRAAEEAARIIGLVTKTGSDRSDSHIVDIFRIGHELKGQGGTLGYPLISQVGASLCLYIESVPDQDRVDPDVILAHANALRVIATEKVSGEGGKIEKQLLAELQKLVQKTVD